MCVPCKLSASRPTGRRRETNSSLNARGATSKRREVLRLCARARRAHIRVILKITSRAWRGYNPCMASTGISKNDAAAVMQLLADYYRTFSTLDLQKTLAFFHEPTGRATRRYCGAHSRRTGCCPRAHIRRSAVERLRSERVEPAKTNPAQRNCGVGHRCRRALQGRRAAARSRRGDVHPPKDRRWLENCCDCVARSRRSRAERLARNTSCPCRCIFD
jgi:hypothetical protein